MTQEMEDAAREMLGLEKDLSDKRDAFILLDAEVNDLKQRASSARNKYRELEKKWLNSL